MDMKFNRKAFYQFLASTTAVAMVAVAPATSVMASSSFTDLQVPGSLSQTYFDEIVAAVTALSDANIINGYEDGTFRPAQSISRAELAKILAGIMELDVTANEASSFGDVTNHWAEQAGVIAAVEGAGIMEGDTLLPGQTTKNFRPNAPIKRAEIAATLVRALALTNTGGFSSTFTDVSGHWANADITTLQANGNLIKGTPEGLFMPEGQLLRRDAAILIDRVMTSMDDEDAAMTITGVNTIGTTFVEVEIDPITQALQDVTVEVKNGSQTIVPTESADITVGATSVQFHFVTPVAVNNLTGVWTVNGVAYSFTELALVADIVNAVAQIPVNEIDLNGLLQDLGITGIDGALLSDYASAINNATPVPVWGSDIQSLIDQVHQAIADAEIVKEVADATTQTQLLTALQANEFERVNPSWIANYYSSASVLLADNSTKGLLALDATNYAGLAQGASVAAIQDAIDVANIAAINAVDANVTSSTEQAAVTVLIETWMKPDEGNVTLKADGIAYSTLREAAFVIGEASTPNTLYNALIAYANLDGALVAPEELNGNLKSFYFTVQQAGPFDPVVDSVDINLVHIADADALQDALDHPTGYLGLVAGSTPTATKAALQKLANYTSHTNDVFDMSRVKESLLAEYRDEIVQGAPVMTASGATARIAAVNGAADVAANIAIITNASSTTIAVRDALTEIAAVHFPGSTVATNYLNVSSQVKLEVAQFVKDNRTLLANPLTDTLVVANPGAPTYATGVIKKAMSDHAAELQKFNNIGNLAAAATTTTTTKAALDHYGYAAYMALSTSDRIDVAEKINELTKGDPAVPLNFAGADAVETLKRANAIIDAAIEKIS